jgi:hypothetical protein
MTGCNHTSAPLETRGKVTALLERREASCWVTLHALIHPLGVADAPATLLDERPPPSLRRPLLDEPFWPARPQTGHVVSPGRSATWQATEDLVRRDLGQWIALV